jgi:hypothetical protein
MNMKWGETGEDHNCCDFDRQENTNKSITKKNIRKRNIIERRT